ncbi:MAG: hypothetical protein K8F25_02640 [Fimbriimonadaceae bacterium]|nr:hypothetical protein [Alphaproteobacteria bacterium]
MAKNYDRAAVLISSLALSPISARERSVGITGTSYNRTTLLEKLQGRLMAAGKATHRVFDTHAGTCRVWTMLKSC